MTILFNRYIFVFSTDTMVNGKGHCLPIVTVDDSTSSNSILLQDIEVKEEPSDHSPYQIEIPPITDNDIKPIRDCTSPYLNPHNVANRSSPYSREHSPHHSPHHNFPPDSSVSPHYFHPVSPHNLQQPSPHVIVPQDQLK